MPRAAALICLAALVAGCHSGHAKKASRRELPAADRSAYVEIASDSGVLRVATVRAALGLGDRIDRRSIGQARARLLELQPADGQLRRLRASLVAACAAATRPVRGRAAVRAVARGALAASDTVNAGLRRYAARHPAVAGLIPD